MNFRIVIPEWPFVLPQQELRSYCIIFKINSPYLCLWYFVGIFHCWMSKTRGKLFLCYDSNLTAFFSFYCRFHGNVKIIGERVARLNRFIVALLRHETEIKTINKVDVWFFFSFLLCHFRSGLETMKASSFSFGVPFLIIYMNCFLFGTTWFGRYCSLKLEENVG